MTPPPGSHMARQVGGVFVQRKWCPFSLGRCSPASGTWLGNCSMGWASVLTHPSEGPFAVSNLHSCMWQPCSWVSLILCHPELLKLLSSGWNEFLTVCPSEVHYVEYILKQYSQRGAGKWEESHRGAWEQE